MNEKIKKFLPDVVAVLLFVVISVAYFFVPMTQGKILYRHDSSAGRGAGQEVSQYYEQTGERSRWTNALFGGMPTYQTAPSYDSGKIVSEAVEAWHLWLPENVWLLFAYLIGFYVLLRAFDFRQYLAMLGAVIWAFSSYFLIIIAAGHLWKVFALAYLFTWIFWIPAIFLPENAAVTLMAVGLLAPAVVSTLFVLLSKSDVLKRDLKNKLVGFYKVKWGRRQPYASSPPCWVWR